MAGVVPEPSVEDAALIWFWEAGYADGHGPHLTTCEPTVERGPLGGLLAIRLREAIRKAELAIARDPIGRDPVPAESPSQPPSARSCGLGRFRRIPGGMSRGQTR